MTNDIKSYTDWNSKDETVIMDRAYVFFKKKLGINFSLTLGENIEFSHKNMSTRKNRKYESWSTDFKFHMESGWTKKRPHNIEGKE